MKKCDTCKHKDRWVNTEPCYSCKGGKDGWEPRTRADRVRAMSDEELARLLTDAECPSDLGGTEKCKDPPPHTSLDSILCRECWLDWLRQEADT